MLRWCSLPAVALAAMLSPISAVARSQDAPPKQPAASLHTLGEYFALAERARKGDLEGAVAEIRTWNWRAFRDLRDAIEMHRRQLEGPSQRIRDRWERPDIEALAMLHTETAIRCPPLSAEEAAHANWAKQLLELFDGLRVDQTFRRRWHVAWGAYLQSGLRFGELPNHLHDALRKWPADSDLLTMMGTMYESWSHPALAARLGPNYVASHSRLQREGPERRQSRSFAERYYRQALEAQPELFDARLRLARMLLEANRLDEALAHVTRAGEHAARPKEQYMARLFLGRVYAGAERWTEAAAAYADAEQLLPDCQVPALASSYAVLKQGARDRARAQVTAALERSSPKRCADPWWEYDFGYGPRADALLERLRESLRR